MTSNGLLSLGSDYLMAPGVFPSDQSLVAPFWTNYDYSRSGQVYYRESTNAADLLKATSAIRIALGDASALETVTSIVIVTWENMQAIGDSVKVSSHAVCFVPVNSCSCRFEEF